MRLRAFIVPGLAAIGLAGCVAAPQVALPPADTVVSGKAGKVGVIMTGVPTPDTEFPGASCLICLGLAEAANSSLTSYSHGLSLDEVHGYKGAVVAALKARGVDVVELPGELDLESLPADKASVPNAPQKNFRGLKDKYAVDHLAVINITNLGFVRNYATYVPTGGPEASIRGEAYIVDLSTNVYDWYSPIDVRRPAEGEWDEPPNFPGLTNAYFQAVELAKDSLVKPISR